MILPPLLNPTTVLAALAPLPASHALDVGFKVRNNFSLAVVDDKPTYILLLKVAKHSTFALDVAYPVYEP
jgi:hypothetical protein